MDHIPRLKSPFRDRPYPAVPLLCSPSQYGLKSRGYKYFHDFPKRLDIQLDCLEPQGINVKNIQSKLPALQSWLFFGVLTEVFGEIEVSVDLNDFVTTQQGQPSKTITTACLEKYLYCWMSAWAHWRGSRTVLTRYARNVDRCLELHSKVVSSIGRLVTSSGEASFPWKSETHAVLLSLAVLGEALQETYQVIDHPVGPQTRDKALLWQFPLLDQALIEAGWCQGEVTTELRRFNMTYLLYLSMIDRHGLDQDHSTCEANRRCRANQVDFARYRTKHVPTCSGKNCIFMGPPMQEVGRVLCEGDIPLITLEKSTQPYTIKVSRAFKDNKSADNYVAISHVWSEGLGNPYENTLPLCQLERLQSLVNSVYSSSDQNNMPFWIDTISVPLVPEMKAFAIASMDRVYAGARGVLVLENSLQRSRADASDIELLVRIGHSVWRTRLWTYQEGRLAQELWIQFQDRAVNMRSLFQTQERYLKAVEILNQESIDNTVSHPNLVQLARALCLEDEAHLLALEHNACLPKQADPKMEENRLLAIEILQRLDHERKICGPWRSRIVSKFPQGPTGDDSRLRTKIFNKTFDTVVRQAQQVRNSTLGRWDSTAKQQLLSEDPGHRMAVQLVDTCNGLEGRRTSRIEDESICLSVLLGLDVRRLLQVPVLHWRLKDALIYVRSFNLGPLFDAVKGFIDRILRDSHERRMKILYSQIDFLPYDVIIWNTPRLHGTGWRWAPASFLVSETETTGPASCNCRISKDGLIISPQRQSLAILTLAAPTQRLDALKDTPCSGDIIQIRFPVPVMEFFLRWKDARLRLKRALPEGRQLWQELLERQRLDEIVILVDRHAPTGTPAGRLGVLCIKYKEEADVTYLHYMALIERCESQEDNDATVIEATFHSMTTSLCID
ncbi:hypothetical protein PV11_05914 [Exophiala sideris]|uniref:Heterokaryon incompatibility domain-containing protein n=1 Tax=Exophiala sideris TaxID=1016849 RepID=A0A0D1YM42_9EURO|nr:hypothetical protein PV11_05914 [Exophiala sideris]